MRIDGNHNWRLLVAILDFTGYVSAAGNLQRRAPEPEPTGGFGTGDDSPSNEITPKWGTGPARGFTFPNNPSTHQSGMNTFDTSRTSGMANSYSSPYNPNVPQLAGTRYRSPSDAGYSLFSSNRNSPDNSGYDGPYLTGDLPETEPDELLYPRLSLQSQGFTDNPRQVLQKSLADKTPDITLGNAMKALGIQELEEDNGVVSPFAGLLKTPPTSGTTTPRNDMSGQATHRYDSGQTSRLGSPRYESPRQYGSPLARDRFTITDPISVASMGDDEGNVEEEDEDLHVNVPVFGQVSGYPGLEFTGPRKVNPVDVDTGTITMSAPTEKELAEPKAPTFASVPQDMSDPSYEKAFVITPGGASSASVKVNAIMDENNEMILAAQFEYFNSNPSKWIVDKDAGGVLRVAGTPYFVYLCHVSGEKTGFSLGDWNELKKLSRSCRGLATDNFYYTGWQIVPSTPKAGLPATAASGEVQFNNARLTSLNKEGLFTIKFPSEKDLLWDIGPGSRVRLPKYVRVTSLPTSKVKKAIGTGMSEDRAFWMYVGSVLPTGNMVKKGWTAANVLEGKPIQLQSSVPMTYPMSWFLTEVDPEPNHFGSKRKWGSEVVMASLESFPKPGVWSYNATRNRIYKWGTKRFMYTCRSEDKGGAFLLSGFYTDALKDCKMKDWIYPIRPTFEDHIGSHGRLSVRLGKGLMWVSPDPAFTTPGFAHSEKGLPTIGRLMTLGIPDYNGMTKKQAAGAKEYREKATMIVEAFVVDVGKNYVQ
ncbi:hypothetical protein TWF730_001887 [Orbilia blumenaviensis]|uniref:Uncharacterized protein n=1 Tax=Orbilia blumenaviensis TaxID=1796055 RepID=A0AAV9UCB3_9PEZI